MGLSILSSVDELVHEEIVPHVSTENLEVPAKIEESTLPIPATRMLGLGQLKSTIQ